MDFQGGVQYGVNIIRERNQNIEIIIVTPMLDSRVNTAYCDALVEISEYLGLQCIDMRNLGIKQDDLYDVYWDHTTQMHPTDSTYYAMGRFIAKYPNSSDYKNYMITYDPQGGYMDIKKSIAMKGEKINQMLITVKQGYVFEGWYTKKRGGELVTEETIYDFGADVTLYAHWSKS